MANQPHTGGCMCAAIRYQVDDDNTWNVYCHCESCRRHTGAPVSVLITTTPDKVKWLSGNRAFYQSSPGRNRAFCRDCGTSLTWETEINGHAWLGIHVNTLDYPETFEPTEHVFFRDKLPWFDVKDELPRKQRSKYIEFGNPHSGQK